MKVSTLFIVLVAYGFVSAMCVCVRLCAISLWEMRLIRPLNARVRVQMKTFIIKPWSVRRNWKAAPLFPPGTPHTLPRTLSCASLCSEAPLATLKHLGWKCRKVLDSLLEPLLLATQFIYAYVCCKYVCVCVWVCRNKFIRIFPYKFHLSPFVCSYNFNISLLATHAVFQCHFC